MQPTRFPLFKFALLMAMGAVLTMAVACQQAASTEKLPPAELFGNTLFKADGTQVGLEALEQKEIILIYFSAQWCPPCRDFTPHLVKALNQLQKDGKPVEMVFVSSDRTREDMFTYMREFKFPGVAVPHNSETSQALGRRYGIRGIPTLIVIDQDGATISTNGHMEVLQQGVAAYDTWQAGRAGAARQKD